MSRFVLLLTGTFLLMSESFSGAGLVSGFRIWHGPDRTRVVFDLTNDVPYEVSVSELPNQLNLDLPDLVLMTPLTFDRSVSGPIESIKTEQSESGGLRVVFGLNEELEYQVFMLAPREPYAFRLVVDLLAKIEPRPTVPLPEFESNAPYLVVIDPGHGGDDPGAIGASGKYEKKVALQISQRLAELINSQGKMRAVLTRTNDYYISLRDRVGFAMREQADVFLSIHANAAKRKGAFGASVFILSEKGAGSELGKWLAQRENAADLAGGVKIGAHEPDLQKTLLDMGIDWKVKESRKLARALLSQLGESGPLHSADVESAAFVVLKAVDIPAVLVETGFMTNPSEEKKLNDRLFQEKIAGALYRGLLAYCNTDVRCPNRGIQNQHYRVAEGDSLALISARMKVSVDALRRVNQLQSDRLVPGQVLTIP